MARVTRTLPLNAVLIVVVREDRDASTEISFTSSRRFYHAGGGRTG